MWRNITGICCPLLVDCSRHEQRSTASFIERNIFLKVFLWFSSHSCISKGLFIPLRLRSLRWWVVGGGEFCRYCTTCTCPASPKNCNNEAPQNLRRPTLLCNFHCCDQGDLNWFSWIKTGEVADRWSVNDEPRKHVALHDAERSTTRPKVDPPAQRLLLYQFLTTFYSRSSLSSPQAGCCTCALYAAPCRDARP